MVKKMKVEMWDQYTYYANRRKRKRTLQMQSCSKEVAKNATRLQEHLDICSLRNSTINEASNGNKKRK